MIQKLVRVKTRIQTMNNFNLFIIYFYVTFIYKMDTYSVNSAVSVGNEVGRDAYSQNQFRVTQNAITIQSAHNTVEADKKQQTSDIEVKSATDTLAAGEMPSALIAIKSKGLGGLAGETAENFRSAGNSILNTVKPPPPPVTPAVGDVVDLGAKPALTTADVGITTADDVSRGMAEGLSVSKGAFSSVAEAGSLSKFMLNRVGGITSSVGLEVGGKALGGLGAGISAEGDISNLIETGKVFKPNESAMSEVGNVASIAGGLLDMASIAVPVLAPLALATNIFSAVTSTVGAVEDDKNQIATDSKPPQQNTLSIHPAWASVGMVASVHSQPSVN